MWRYIIGRFFYGFGIWLIVSFISFAILRVIPIELNVHPQIRKEVEQQLRQQYGIGAPIWVQYIKWLNSILQGKLGPYIEQDGDISDVGKELFGFGRCPGFKTCYILNTVILNSITLILTWTIGMTLGIYAATHKGMIRERALSIAGYLWLGLPHFLLALLLSTIGYEFFSKGYWEPNSYGDLHYFLLFAIMIGAANIAFIMRHMRSSLLEVLNEDYVRTARSQGFSERFVVYRRALKNALNPLISMFGFSIPMLFEGTLIIAFIYKLPVVERQYWDAFTGGAQPYMAASGLLFFTSLLLLGNFIADLLLLWSNPKIRYR